MTTDYAILKTGGKQYRVKPGDELDVEKLPAEEGAYIELGDILAVSRNGELSVGNPLIADASVLAQVRSQYRDKKILVFKYKRKVRYRRKKGHRQPYTRLYITSITHAGEEIGLPDWPEASAFAEEELVEDVAVAALAVEEPEEEEPAESVSETVESSEDEAPVQVVDAAVEEPEEEAPTGSVSETVESSEDEAPVQVVDDAMEEPEEEVPAGSVSETVESSKDEAPAQAVDAAIEEPEEEAPTAEVEERAEDEGAVEGLRRGSSG